MIKMVANMVVPTGCVSGLFALAFIACSSAPETPLHAPEVPVPVIDAGPVDAEGASISEVQARLLLNQKFRDAGLRIVNDYPFRQPDIEVTLDGYDPERGIGFEYLAPAERGADLDAREESLLRAHKGIFVASGGSLVDLERSVEAFLSKQSGEIPHTSAGTK
jgi:hypothetical protein